MGGGSEATWLPHGLAEGNSCCLSPASCCSAVVAELGSLREERRESAGTKLSYSYWKIICPHIYGIMGCVFSSVYLPPNSSLLLRYSLHHFLQLSLFSQKCFLSIPIIGWEGSPEESRLQESSYWYVSVKKSQCPCPSTSFHWGGCWHHTALAEALLVVWTQWSLYSELVICFVLGVHVHTGQALSYVINFLN